MAKRYLNFGTSLGALPFEPFGFNAMTKSSTMNNGTTLGSNVAYGMNSLSMPRLRGNGWSKNQDLQLLRGGHAPRFWQYLGGRPLEKAQFTTWSGVGKGNIGSLIFPLLGVPMVAWGLSLTGGMGLVLGLGIWWVVCGEVGGYLDVFNVVVFLVEGPRLASPRW